MSGIIALDLETTGLIKPDYMPGIMELGVATTQTWSESELYSDSWIINPEVPIDPEALEVTGMNGEEVVRAATFPELFNYLWGPFLGCHTLLTYNGPSFDIPILKATLERYNLSTRFPWPPKQIDVMLIGNDAMGIRGKSGIKPPKLTELYEELFQKGYGAHRAGEDAKATLDCYIELEKRGWKI